MKLSDIAKGTRAIRRVSLPLCNVRCPELPDLPELAAQRAADKAAHEASRAGQAPSAAPDTISVEVGLRVLTGEETAEVLQKAAEFARARGSTDPKQGDPLYDFGVMVHTVAIAAVDPDSDPARPTPFVASAEELLASPHVGREGIVFLAEAQEAWQDLCSPQLGKFTADDIFAYAERMSADPTPRFFEQLRPGARWIFARSMASLLRISPLFKSLSGLSTTESGSDSSTQSDPDPVA